MSEWEKEFEKFLLDYDVPNVSFYQHWFDDEAKKFWVKAWDLQQNKLDVAIEALEKITNPESKEDDWVVADDALEKIKRLI
jgi:hypothetical protein